MIGVAAIASVLLVQQVPISSLEWLSGTWRTTDSQPRSGPAFVEEIWTDARYGTLIGMSRTVEAGSVRGFEYLRIAADGADLALFASPGGAPSVRFVVARTGPREIIFENAAHDYPQRITYRREGDRLHATISLIDGSRARSWNYRRVTD